MIQGGITRMEPDPCRMPPETTDTALLLRDPSRTQNLREPRDRAGRAQTGTPAEGLDRARQEGQCPAGRRLGTIPEKGGQGQSPREQCPIWNSTLGLKHTLMGRQ